MNDDNGPAQNSFALLREHSLSSLAQVEIEKLILSGVVSPGERLGEAELAVRLGVSRGPIREAFRSLEEQGLVRVEKNRGVFVRQISIEQAEEAYAIRVTLEAMAVEVLATGSDETQVAALQNIIAEMTSAHERDDRTAYSDLNLRFHDALIRFTGNKTLHEIYRRLVTTLTLYRHRSLSTGDTPSVSLEEHRRIVDAIVSRDPKAAVAAVTAHVNTSRQRMRALHTAASSESNRLHERDR